jgi:serine/threonine protein kinase
LLFNPERKKDKVLTVKTTRRKIGHGNQADVLLAYECSKPSHQLVVRRIDVKPSKKEEIESQILKKNRHVSASQRLKLFDIHTIKGQCFGYDSSVQKRPNSAFVFPIVSTCKLFHRPRVNMYEKKRYIGGTLRQRVKQKSCLTEENASFLFKQVLSGLQVRISILHI